MKKLLLTVIVVGAMSCTTAWSAIDLSFGLVDNSAVLTGYVTQDMNLSTDSDWLSAQLLIVLDSGSVYHDTLFGGHFTTNPPTPDQITFQPTLEFETYLTSGENVDTSIASISGGAVDLGGQITETFDETGIVIGWSTNATDDIGDLMLARITLSDDANGTWKVRVSNLNDGPILPLGPVVNGRLVPEPATIMVLAFGALAVLGGRRG